MEKLLTPAEIKSEPNYFGYGYPSRFETEIMTPEGMAKCTMQRIRIGTEDVIEVNMWRSYQFLESGITAFCAGVYMFWNGKEYKIKRRLPADYTNPFWLQLEKTISNTILINE